MKKQGKVYLIGAGPGDPGLLTLKGRDCLAEADAVVYDRLADPRILGWVRPEAERIYVGKASAQHTMKQEDINKLLVKLAAEGKIVARLKRRFLCLWTGRRRSPVIERKRTAF